MKDEIKQDSNNINSGTFSFFSFCLCTCQGADNADHGGDCGHGVREEQDGDSDHDHPGEQDGLQALAEDGQVLVSVQEVVIENIGFHVLIAKTK